jgi:hypothetical protein
MQRSRRSWTSAGRPEERASSSSGGTTAVNRKASCPICNRRSLQYVKAIESLSDRAADGEPLEPHRKSLPGWLAPAAGAVFGAGLAVVQERRRRVSAKLQSQTTDSSQSTPQALPSQSTPPVPYDSIAAQVGELARTRIQSTAGTTLMSDAAEALGNHRRFTREWFNANVAVLPADVRPAAPLSADVRAARNGQCELAPPEDGPTYCGGLYLSMRRRPDSEWILRLQDPLHTAPEYLVKDVPSGEMFVLLGDAWTSTGAVLRRTKTGYAVAVRPSSPPGLRGIKPLASA